MKSQGEQDASAKQMSLPSHILIALQGTLGLDNLCMRKGFEVTTHTPTQNKRRGVLVIAGSRSLLKKNRDISRNHRATASAVHRPGTCRTVGPLLLRLKLLQPGQGPLQGGELTLLSGDLVLQLLNLLHSKHAGGLFDEVGKRGMGLGQVESQLHRDRAFHVHGAIVNPEVLDRCRHKSLIMPLASKAAIQLLTSHGKHKHGKQVAAIRE